MKVTKKTMLALLVSALLVCAAPVGVLANDVGESAETTVTSVVDDGEVADESPLLDGNTDYGEVADESPVIGETAAAPYTEDAETSPVTPVVAEDAEENVDDEVGAVDMPTIIDMDTFQLAAGEQRDLSTLLRIENTFGLFRWSSSDPAVASIENGVVTAGLEGSATITATFSQGDGVSYSQRFIIEVGSGLTDYLMLDVGDTRDLRDLTHPGFDEAGNYGTIWYASSDDSIASVTSSGKVTAHANGGVTITETYTAPDGIVSQREIRVTVNTNYNTVFYVDTIVNLETGLQRDLLPILHPNYTNAVTYGTIEWRSENASVATVNSSGVVTARSAGDATIMAILTDPRGETSLQYVTVRVS